MGLLAATALTIFIISWLQFWQIPPVTIPQGIPDASGRLVESPFKNSMAYIRWNSNHPERIPTIQEGYEPFFQTLHYSVPNIVPKADVNSKAANEFLNLTHDAWEEATDVYASVRNTMQFILEDPVNTIDGILYFHFDAWIDPLGFGEMNFDKIWFPDSAEPKHSCMNNTNVYGSWWGWQKGFHDKALAAAKLVKELAPEFEVDTKEWCVGCVSRHIILIGQN